MDLVDEGAADLDQGHAGEVHLAVCDVGGGVGEAGGFEALQNCLSIPPILHTRQTVLIHLYGELPRLHQHPMRLTILLSQSIPLILPLTLFLFFLAIFRFFVLRIFT